MKKSLLLALSFIGLTGAALAAEAPLTGDAAAGKALSASCAACHGQDGNSPAPTFPKLAGQNERYLAKQMHDIKSGARPVPTMAGQLDGKSDQDIADIAAYFAAQTTTTGQADPELIKLGESIYRGGIREKNVPACAACHSPDGRGVALAGFPHLAGQHAEYTEAQLKAFRAGGDGDPNGRHNDGEETRTMRTIAYRMSDSEIKAVSSYIQGLH